jgi:hypothetical protein
MSGREDARQAAMSPIQSGRDAADDVILGGAP